MNPQNTGTIADADGIGRIGDAQCGDVIKVWITVKNKILTDVKSQVFGCPAAVASCSMMTVLAKGKTIDQARQLTDEQVAEALGGLPPQKMHCSNMAASVLHKAIDDYLSTQNPQTQTLKITALMNNDLPEGLQTEHGLSFWIEVANKKILFDTGQSDRLMQNAKTLGIDLSQTDAVVISHGHYDHTGGLQAVLNAAPGAAVYIHPDAPRIRYSCRPGQPPKNIAMGVEACRKLAEAAAKANIVYTTQPSQIAAGLTVTGPVPRCTDYEDTGGPFFLDKDAQNPDPITDDQALLIRTAKGLVVILGCAHAGLINTFRHAAAISGQKEIHAVIGGTHLRSASEERIEKTLKDLKYYNIRHIAPCHCTGVDPAKRLQQQYPKAFHDLTQTTTVQL